MAPAAAPGTRRLVFLDVCRGVAVVTMLGGNLVNVFLRRVPQLLAHNQGDVLRPFDLPAPTFQFLIGVSLAFFLRARAARGRNRTQAKLDALRRFTLLVLLGMLLDCVGALQLQLRWGVLQTLGLGGVIATLLADVSAATLAAVAIALLGAFSGAMNGEVHANPISALAFVPLSLAGLLVGRASLGPSPARGCVLASAAVAVLAGGLAAVLYAAGIPFNKLVGTSSFVAFASAAAAVLLGALAGFEAAVGWLPEWLATVGRNALTAWVLQYVLVFYPAWLFFPGWHRLTIRPGLLVVTLTIWVLSQLAVSLGRRGIRVPI